MRAQKRLQRFGWIIVFGNFAAAVLAVVVNWPTQFDYVGTDAGADVLSRGTAISAPLLPIALLMGALLALHRNWERIGLVGYSLVALLVLIGGLGELTAPGTGTTPKSVLVLGGAIWVGVATAMLALVYTVIHERRRSQQAGRTHADPA